MTAFSFLTQEIFITLKLTGLITTNWLKGFKLLEISMSMMKNSKALSKDYVDQILHKGLNAVKYTDG